MKWATAPVHREPPNRTFRLQAEPSSGGGQDMQVVHSPPPSRMRLTSGTLSLDTRETLLLVLKIELYKMLSTTSYSSPEKRSHAA